jgi:hypothetical protein
LFIEKVHGLFQYPVGIGIHSSVQKNRVVETHRFVASRRDLIRLILPQIIPYLIVKKSNAIEMLNWFETGQYDVSKTDITGKTISGKKGGSSGKNGNWGNSEAHSVAARNCKNNHLKGNWGNSEAHSVAAKKAFMQNRA